MLEGVYRIDSQEDGILIWLKYCGYAEANNIDEIIYTTIWNNEQYTISVMAGGLDEKIVEEIDKIVESACAFK